MRRTGLLPLLLVAGLTCVATARSHEGHAQVKHHHELRGVIGQVDPDKNEFSLKTDQGQVVLCVVDGKTVLKRGGAKIKLADVRSGERARCHCAALREGRHYSQQLLLESKKEP